jgi:small subunit ribosomal protein S1
MLAEFEREQPSTGKSKAKKVRGPQIGAEIKGRVLSIGRDAVFIDLGGKDDGILAIDEVRGPDGQLTVAVGDEVSARVVELDGRSGGVVLRRVLGRGADSRAELQQAFELGIPVEGQVTGVVKGGVEVQVAGVRAFCPISQLELRHVEDASPLVGQKHRFRITRFEETGRSVNVVLSRRALLEEDQRAQAAELRKRLVVGAVLRGKVSAIKDYGAFIDLGGIEGMLHVSELSFQRARHPKDVLTIGQEIEVQVIKLERVDDPRKADHKLEKVSLSLKSLERDPWSEVETRLPEGTRLPGTVARLETFGAFVELEPGIEGLVHISELGKGRQLRHSREALKVGQRVEVVVQAVDREKRRISLALAGGEGDREVGELPAPVSSAPARFGTLGDLLNKAAKKK